MSRESSLVQYGSFDITAAKEQQEEAARASGRGIFVGKLPEGKSVFRVLPPMVGQKSPFRVCYEHYLEVGGQRNRFVCPAMETDAPCPACAIAHRMMASKNQIDRKQGKQMSCKRRVFANVIDRKAPNDGPKIWGFGQTIHDKLTELRLDEDIGGDYTHPVTGFDIVVIRSGTGQMDTEYNVVRKPEKSPLSQDNVEMNGWLKSMHDLGRVVRVPPADDIEQMLQGRRPERRDEESFVPSRTAAQRVYDQE